VVWVDDGVASLFTHTHTLKKVYDCRRHVRI
jgi:hypothetical protein